jgi:hypothetical protein
MPNRLGEAQSRSFRNLLSCFMKRAIAIITFTLASLGFAVFISAITLKITRAEVDEGSLYTIAAGLLTFSGIFTIIYVPMTQFGRSSEGPEPYSRDSSVLD